MISRPPKYNFRQGIVEGKMASFAVRETMPSWMLKIDSAARGDLLAGVVEPGSGWLM